MTEPTISQQKRLLMIGVRMHNETAVCSFPIKPSRKAIAWSWAFLIFVVLMEAGLFLNFKNMDKAVFAIIPSALLVVGIMAAITFSLHFKKVRCEVSTKGLQIRGDMWGRLIPWSELDAPNARLVSFKSDPGLKLKWRTAGTALPGYSAGWFRLQNKSKALAFLSDSSDFIYIPTRKDYSVLLSAENNRELLQAIQQGGT